MHKSNSSKVEYNDLEDFKHKNKTINKSKTETHQCVGASFRENFYVSPENYDTFMKLYIKELKTKEKLTILEKTQDVGPLYYDFDIKTKKDEKIFTIEEVKDIALCITNTIKQNYNIEESDNSSEESNDKKPNDILMAYILVKDKATHDEKKQLYSNGFHIHYPYTHVSLIDKLFLFEQIHSKLIENKNIKKIVEDAETTFDALIDEKIITGTKWWYLYGSGKMTNGVINDYKVKAVINSKGVEFEEGKQSTLVKLLSIIKPNNIINLSIKQKKYSLYETFKTKNKEKSEKKTDIKKYFENTNDDDDEELEDNKNLMTEELNNIKMAGDLLKMLNKTRANDYSTWSCVCCALCSISKHLKNEFHIFSKLSKKYNKDDCNTFWEDTLSRNNSGFGMHSLKGWAKKDNPHAYLNFKNEHTMQLLDNVNNLQAEYDIAEIIHFLYRDEFVCVDLKQNTWFYFNGVKWIENKEAYTLSNKLSKDFALECQKRSSHYMEKAISTNGNESDKFMTKRKIMSDLAVKMRGKYKDSVLKQARTIFYDSDFIKKLNDDNYLVGFENGVYDLNKSEFRNTTPEDYISFTVGYNFSKNIKQNVIDEVENFLTSIMPDETELLYLMCYIASILEGGNKNQIFMVWTGSGSNGKGSLTQLIDIAFGDYYSTVDVSLLTQTRGNAGSASPQVADKVAKRCLFVSEPDEGAKLQASYMKNLTGEDKIQSRALYQDPFYYYPKFKLCLQCNDLPEIISIDGGTWRRIKVLLFGQKFVENPTKPNEHPLNPELRNKIKTWGPAFMYLLIHKYYPIYQSKGLSKLEPESVRNSTKTYKDNSDSFSEFLNHYDKIESVKEYVIIDELWASYSEWLKKDYPNAKLSNSRKLKQYLELAGYNVNKNKVLGLKRKEDLN